MPHLEEANRNVAAVVLERDTGAERERAVRDVMKNPLPSVCGSGCR
jgi:hypothetical protein